MQKRSGLFIAALLAAGPLTTGAAAQGARDTGLPAGWELSMLSEDDADTVVGANGRQPPPRVAPTAPQWCAWAACAVIRSFSSPTITRMPQPLSGSPLSSTLRPTTGAPPRPTAGVGGGGSMFYFGFNDPGRRLR